MNNKSSVVIVGAGPAGSSLAIRLARKGLVVTLIDKDTFPREKLCGEFISPECFFHFGELGIRQGLFGAGGERIYETRFISRGGRSVSVPTEWFGQGPYALSLSRSVMDNILLTAARNEGVQAIDGARVISAATGGGRLRSVVVRHTDGRKVQIEADIFVDASGRSAVLSKLVDKPVRRDQRAKLVAYKAHLRGVTATPGVCDIYFFDGGYGGLSHVEDGRANFCFIIRPSRAREFIGKTNHLWKSLAEENFRARERLANAEPAHDWLAVTVEEFGIKRPAQPDNVIAVGDAGAFIDPFTGSGMLMALQSSELLSRYLTETSLEKVRYVAAHRRLFRRRLAVSNILRRAAFAPGLASGAIQLAGLHNGLRSLLARATRSETGSA